MSAFVQKEEKPIAVFGLTASEFLSQMTGIALVEAKACIKTVIREHKSQSFSIKLKQNPDNFYLLSIRTLREDSKNTIVREEEIAQSIGILLEIINVTQQENFYTNKELMANTIKTQFSNDLQSILLALHLLEDKKLNSDEKEKILRIARDKTIGTVKFMEEAQNVLDLGLQYEMSAQKRLV